MLNPNGRRAVYAMLIALFVISVALVHDLRPKHERMLVAQMHVVDPRERNAQTGSDMVDRTPFQAVLPVLLGFREVLAALMWIQADDLFHRGEYGPILSLVKRITLIDPHNLDVYATGAWHMAYNFLDRRLVDDGVKFLEEGVANNPHVYDLFFELGYMHYDKTKNFPEAARWYGEGRYKATTAGKMDAPPFVYSAYCHALERAGNIDAALEAWKESERVARREVNADPDNYLTKSSLAAARHNQYMTRRRLNEREATWMEWQGRATEALEMWKRNVALAEEYLREEPGRNDVRDKDLRDARANVARVQAGRLGTGQPKDMKFNFTVKRLAPRRLLVEGTIDLPYMARVTVALKDVNYDEIAGRGLQDKMANGTLWLDNLVHVRDGKFRQELKLDEDPAEVGRPPSEVYPLKSQKYLLSVTFNPRLQSAEVQDRMGWNGEGLTDRHNLKVDAGRAGSIRGQKRPLRFLQKTVELQRSDIV